MRVATLAFCFWEEYVSLRLNQSNHIFCRKYGKKRLKEKRKFEKLYYKLRKKQLDLEFLCISCEKNVILKFLNFCLANKSRQDCLTYKKCEHNLSLTEINVKKSHLTILKNKLDLLHNELKYALNCIDFAHVCNFFLHIKIMILKVHYFVQQTKFEIIKVKATTLNFQVNFKKRVN